MKASVLLLSAVFCFAVSRGAEVFFYHSPPSVDLRLGTIGKATQPDVSALLGNLMGFTANRPVSWQGSGDLLHRPEALLFLEISDSQELLQKLQLSDHFDAPNPDSDEIYGDLVRGAGSAFAGDSFLHIGPDTKEISLGDEPKELVKTKDERLRRDFEHLHRVTAWLKENGPAMRDGTPDLIYLKLHSVKSEKAMQEASDLLHKLFAEFKLTYAGNCLIAVLSTTSTAHSRHKRLANPGFDKGNVTEFTQHDFTDPGWPAQFALMLGVFLLIALIVIFVAVGMWFIDPGKDTIIYRMTATRVKKD